MSRRVLAQQGVCQLQSCSCGSFHLVVGPVSLTLTSGALADVAAATAVAMNRILAAHAETNEEPRRAPEHDPLGTCN